MSHLRPRRRRLAAILAAAVVTAAVAAQLGAAAGVAAPQVSSNWSGYAVTGTNAIGAPVKYTSVTGTWTVTPAKCGATSAGFASAFWVGLGGYLPSSQKLEQAGTDADCDDSGKPDYYAWYELVPKPSIDLPQKVMPGNVITTTVTIVSPTRVVLVIVNHTRHWKVTKDLSTENPDTTSAEWIAEAPSLCNRNTCSILPLANFGSMSFAKLSAVGDGISGTVADTAWTVEPIDLVPKSQRAILQGRRPVQTTGFGHIDSVGGAEPAVPTPDGTTFAVNYQANPKLVAGSTPVPVG
jgi:hypothetical protein